MSDADGDGREAVTVSFRPAERSVPAGEQATFELAVDGAERGISAYESAVYVGDGARVVRASLTGDPAVPVVDLVEDGTAAVLAAAMGPESGHDGAGETVVAALTVRGETTGRSVELAIDDETEVAPVGGGPDRYTVGQCGTATLRVVEPDWDDPE